LSIILAQNGIIGLPQAIFIILGSNIGTTTTAFIASIRMNRSAKKAALAHFLFNLLGVVLILPFIYYFIDFASLLGNDVGHRIANAHTIFNVLMAAVFLIFIKPFEKTAFNLNFDFGTEEHGAMLATESSNGQWWGFSGIVNQDITDYFGLALRGEYFDDHDGARLGVSGLHHTACFFHELQFVGALHRSHICNLCIGRLHISEKRRCVVPPLQRDLLSALLRGQ